MHIYCQSMDFASPWHNLFLLLTKTQKTNSGLTPTTPYGRRRAADRQSRSPKLCWSPPRASRHGATETARAVAAIHDKDHKRKIVLVAPPKTLAALRETLGGTLGTNVLAEVDKDLTHHPVREIERLLTAA